MLQEQNHIKEINDLVALGFSNVKRETLTALYIKVYGKSFPTHCGQCYYDAFEKLKSYALNKTRIYSTKNNFMSTFRIKHEFINQTFSFFYKGQKHIVNASNITPEQAEILANIPKYKHCMEEVQGNEKERPGKNTSSDAPLKIVAKTGSPRKPLKDVVAENKTVGENETGGKKETAGNKKKRGGGNGKNKTGK